MGITNTTAGALVRDNIYALVYGPEGVGKTRLPLSLDPSGKSCGWVTAEPTGPTTIAAYNPTAKVKFIHGEDQIRSARQGVIEFAREKDIRVICVDGLHVLCSSMIDQLSGGEGEKALGFDGWQRVLADFRSLEIICNKVVASGRSVIYTALELAPQYETDAFNRNEKVLVEEGRPFLQGKAKMWMPAQCDIVARMGSKVRTVVNPATKKPEKVWEGFFTLDRSGPYVCKTRWKLPSPYPADLGKLLRDVKAAKAAMQTTTVAAPLKK